VYDFYTRLTDEQFDYRMVDTPGSVNLPFFSAHGPSSYMARILSRCQDRV
jgi:hypothetical protein